MSWRQAEMRARDGVARRPYIRPDGTHTMIEIPWCLCDDQQRGPAGGVCGRCGGAIPEEKT